MFPFGVSFQEILFLTALLTVAGGYKKQFFQYSRSSGKFVGRAVGFIRQKRDQVFTSTGQQKELTALQQQLEEAMSQMQHIRYDIRSSARIMPSQQQYSEAHSDAAASEKPLHRETATGLPFHAADPLATTVAATRGQSSVTASPDFPERFQPPSFPSHPPADVARAATHGQVRNSTAPEALRSSPVPQAAAARQVGSGEVSFSRLQYGEDQRVQHDSRPSSTGPRGAGVSAEALAKFDSIEVGDGKELMYIDGVPLIPVNAEDAGKAPSVKRSAAPLTGADIMEAALAEQLVAKKAASLFKPEGDEGEGGA